MGKNFEGEHHTYKELQLSSMAKQRTLSGMKVLIRDTPPNYSVKYVET